MDSGILLELLQHLRRCNRSKPHEVTLHSLLGILTNMCRYQVSPSSLYPSLPSSSDGCLLLLFNGPRGSLLALTLLCLVLPGFVLILHCLAATRSCCRRCSRPRTAWRCSPRSCRCSGTPRWEQALGEGGMAKGRKGVGTWGQRSTPARACHETNTLKHVQAHILNRM
jgi:hypothetical protein